jgi:hypothetical protein
MLQTSVATKVQLVVVPHAHGAREGALPFEQARLNRVRLIDRLLEIFATDPEYTHFLLDVQTVILDDYLEVHPEKEAVLRELISSGKLTLGPWYVQPEESLVSGESLIRNLQIGIGSARRFGRAMELGMLAGSFGHAAQLPQVFAGFGFEAGCVWGGQPEAWIWEALDGSGITLHHLPVGFLMPESFEEALQALDREAEAPGFGRIRILLTEGVPEPDFPRYFHALNRSRVREWEVVQASLPEAIARARREAGDLDVRSGELRESNLTGQLSARIPLKVRNAQAQTLLERWVEPFSAFASLAGRDYPQAMLKHAWRLLLQNHAQPALGGSASDEVHRQMLTRFERLEVLSRTLRDEAFAALQGEFPKGLAVQAGFSGPSAPAADQPRQEGLRLYNPHPWEHLAPVETAFTLDAHPTENGTPVFSLLDEEGLPLSYEILSLEHGSRPSGDGEIETVTVRLRLLAMLPPLGYRTLKIERELGDQPRHPELYHGSDWIENRYFKVRILAGGIELFDKTLEERIIHTFEDQADQGDALAFMPLPGDAPVDSLTWEWDSWQIVHAGSSLRLLLKGTWALPQGLSQSRQERDGNAPLHVQMAIALHAGVRRVDVTTTFANKSGDHRLRAVFQTPDAIEQLHADTAFGWVKRDCLAPEQAAFPMQSQVLIERPEGLAGLAAIGLHELEARDKTLHLTLLRAFGRQDRTAVPEAQCLGSQTYRYAWVSQDADEPFGTAIRRGQEFVVPALASPLADWKGHRMAELIEIDQPAWQFSALKRSESGKHLVLRVFNASPEAQTGTIQFGFPVDRVVVARLDEMPGEELPLGPRQFTAELRPHEVATFLIVPRSR